MSWNVQHHKLKHAFLKVMDNKASNDYQAHVDIARLSCTMSDSQIHSAYADAHNHATRKNSKKNGYFDRNDPYKNVDSLRSHGSHHFAMQQNDWMNYYPCVPPGLWSHLWGGY